MLSLFHIINTETGRPIRHDMVDPTRVEAMNAILVSWEVPGKYVICDCIEHLHRQEERAEA